MLKSKYSTSQCNGQRLLCYGKSTLKLEFQYNVFENVPDKVISAHCIVTLNILTVITVMDENHKQCTRIFSILPINVSQACIF